MEPPTEPAPRPHVVIIGGGFGGLETAKALADAPVDVTLVDRANHHLFQPLLYQVATAGLAPASIAAPIRGVLRRQANTRVLLAEVTDIDLSNKRLTLHDDEDHEMAFDALVIAVGACTTYFGNEQWAAVAPGLKSLDEAIEIRRRVLLAYEQAEREDDPAARDALLTFVVVGGGPTGVEMAGALSELSRFVLARDFRRIKPENTRVVLVEGGDRVLSSFEPGLSDKAIEQLDDLGVDVRCGWRVNHIDADGVRLKRGDVEETIAARTVVWAAGVRANPLVEALEAPLDRAGRVMVEPDCSVPGQDRVFVIGDAAHFEQDGEMLPGVSPVAMQQGRFVARTIVDGLAGRPSGRFRYRDKGSMATIGRSRAIAQMGSVGLSGFMAWMAWLVVHLYFLIGFRSRLVVLLNWAWSYFTYQRGSRLITGGRLIAGPPGDESG